MTDISGSASAGVPPVNFNPPLKAPQAAVPRHCCLAGAKSMIGIKKLVILSSISVLLGFGKNVDTFAPIGKGGKSF